MLAPAPTRPFRVAKRWPSPRAPAASAGRSVPRRAATKAGTTQDPTKRPQDEADVTLLRPATRRGVRQRPLRPRGTPGTRPSRCESTSAGHVSPYRPQDQTGYRSAAGSASAAAPASAGRGPGAGGRHEEPQGRDRGPISVDPLPDQPRRQLRRGPTALGKRAPDSPKSGPPGRTPPGARARPRSVPSGPPCPPPPRRSLRASPPDRKALPPAVRLHPRKTTDSRRQVAADGVFRSIGNPSGGSLSRSKDRGSMSPASTASKTGISNGTSGPAWKEPPTELRPAHRLLQPPTSGVN